MPFNIRQIWVSMGDLEPIPQGCRGITIVNFVAPLLGTHPRPQTFLSTLLISTYWDAGCLDPAPEPAVGHILMVCGE